MATATLHITMPVIISVTASNVSTPALVEVTTMQGNIINIGMDLSLDPNSSVTETMEPFSVSIQMSSRKFPRQSPPYGKLEIRRVAWPSDRITRTSSAPLSC